MLADEKPGGTMLGTCRLENEKEHQPSDYQHRQCVLHVA